MLFFFLFLFWDCSSYLKSVWVSELLQQEFLLSCASDIWKPVGLFFLLLFIKADLGLNVAKFSSLLHLRCACGALHIPQPHKSGFNVVTMSRFKGMIANLFTSGESSLRESHLRGKCTQLLLLSASIKIDLKPPCLVYCTVKITAAVLPLYWNYVENNNSTKTGLWPSVDKVQV